MLETDLSTAYQAMASDAEREQEALEWGNGLIGDVAEADSAAR